MGEHFNLTKREELSAPLPHLIHRTWELVDTFVRTRYRLRGIEMTRQIEYPKFAWREVIVNAIAHRDYSIAGTAIQIRMFDDRLEVESPGGLPGIVTIDNIRRRHFSRNPQIVSVLKTWQYMEELGFGIDRVFREMKSVGAPPPRITDDQGTVTITLYAAHQAALPDGTDTGLNERQKRVLNILAERGQITNREYRETFGISNATAYADLAKLVEMRLVERVGKGRAVYYQPPTQQDNH